MLQLLAATGMPATPNKPMPEALPPFLRQPEAASAGDPGMQHTRQHPSQDHISKGSSAGLAGFEAQQRAGAGEAADCKEAIEPVIPERCFPSLAWPALNLIC